MAQVSCLLARTDRGPGTLNVAELPENRHLSVLFCEKKNKKMCVQDNDRGKLTEQSLPERNRAPFAPQCHPKDTAFT